MKFSTKLLAVLTVGMLANGHASAASDLTSHPTNMTFAGDAYQAGMLLNATLNASGDYVVHVKGQGFATVAGSHSSGNWLSTGNNNKPFVPSNVFRVESGSQATPCVSVTGTATTASGLVTTTPINVTGAGCNQLYSVASTTFFGTTYATTPIGLDAKAQPDYDLVIPAAVATKPFVISWQHLQANVTASLAGFMAPQVAFSWNDTIEIVDSGNQTFTVGQTWSFGGVAQAQTTSMGMKVVASKGNSTGLHDYTLSASMAVASNDFGKLGQIWLAALYNGALFFYSPAGGWIQWNGNLAVAPAAWQSNVTLGNITSMPIVPQPTDIRSLAGAAIIVAYGVGSNAQDAWDSFLARKTYQTADTLTGTAADVAYQQQQDAINARIGKNAPLVAQYNQGGVTVTYSGGSRFIDPAKFTFFLDDQGNLSCKATSTMTTTTGPITTLYIYSIDPDSLVMTMVSHSQVN